MENAKVRKGFLAEAIIAGFVIGLGMFLVSVASMLFQWQLSGGKMLESVLRLAVIVACAFLFLRRHAASAGDEGLTYGQGVGFVVVCMAFAGVLAGFGELILHAYINPGYYAEVTEAALEKSRQALQANPILAQNPEQMDMAVGMARRMATNPVIIFFGYLTNQIIIGTLVALFLSIFTRKRPARQ